MNTLFNSLPRRVRLFLISLALIGLVLVPVAGCSDDAGQAGALATGHGIPALQQNQP